MSDRLYKLGRTLFWILITLGLSLACVFALKLAGVFAEPQPSASGLVSETVQEGRAFIQAQEALAPEAVEETIRAQEQAKLDAARLKELLSDTDKLFSAFREDNIVLVGESRTSGFTYYGWLDDNHFLGGVGWNIYQIPDLFDRIAELHPSILIFSFGLNDMPPQIGEGGYISSPKEYMEVLEGYFDTIRDLVPDVSIYMDCIVPCTEDAYVENPGFRAIPEWNAYIEKYCKKHGYGYIDISDISAAHEEMYASDGEHVASEFYPLWGARILETILQPEK